MREIDGFDLVVNDKGFSACTFEQQLGKFPVLHLVPGTAGMILRLDSSELSQSVHVPMPVEVRSMITGLSDLPVVVVDRDGDEVVRVVTVAVVR